MKGAIRVKEPKANLAKLENVENIVKVIIKNIEELIGREKER